ncbi:MAG TPA: VIT1/CCC1 transporter family protein [Kiritimatiellia bacterium]|nr:VIT1/CCC1 transporter family protein [Kiritimatiellia bacterium]
MSLMKRLDEARGAFARRDVEASKRAHNAGVVVQAAETHRKGHQYIGDVVYGGLDGIVTTFAVVSGVAGADLSVGIVLIMGMANLLGDGFSMATGAYLSARSEQEYYDRERSREEWEVAHYPDGEKQEMTQLYKTQGYSAEEAERLVEIQSRDPKRFVDVMMVHELGMLPDDRPPLSSAIATFISFIVFGSVPLLVYFVGFAAPAIRSIAFPVAAVLTAVALFGLGSAKHLVTSRSGIRSGLETLVVGSLAAIVAYAVGYFMRGLGG